MIKRLLLLAVIILVALPATVTVLAQDDLTETLELPDFGFTMSYPDGWEQSGDPASDGFAAVAEDDRDFDNLGSFGDLRGQLVVIIPLPEEALSGLGEEAADRLSSFADNFGASLRARDVDQIDIEGGYDTFIGAPDVEDAFILLAEVDGGEGFAFFILAASPADAEDDMQANFEAMLDTIDIGAASDDGGNDGGGSEVDTGDAEDIEYGDTVEGTIDDDTPTVVYAFEGSEGDVVTVTMVDTSRRGTLDPYIQLVNEDGDVVAENDDADSDADLPDSLDSQITEFELDSDGTYFVVATRFGQENGSSEGDYELTLDEGGGGGSDNNDNGNDSGNNDNADIVTIEYGDTVEGEITDDTVYVYYSFEGSEGDVVTITLVDTSRSGDLDPYVGLVDENGDVIAENDDAERSARLPDSYDSQITEFELPDDGTYVIIATRYGFEDGTGEGEFELTLEEGG
ncbi:MAG: pre-peptidase C-terminal domain-containing protein [Anaerolineae bacterium]